MSFVEGLFCLKRVEHQTVKAAVHHFVDCVLMRFNNDRPQRIIACELVALIQYVFAEGYLRREGVSKRNVYCGIRESLAA